MRPGGPLLLLAAQRRLPLTRLAAEDAKNARSANTLVCARATVKTEQGTAENVATGTSSERPRLMVVSDLDCTMVSPVPFSSKKPKGGVTSKCVNSHANW